MIIENEYSEKLAIYYDLIYNNKDYEQESIFIKNLVSHQEVKRILDVGCGTGKHLNYLVGDEIEEIVGTDLSLPMIKQAKKNKDKNNKIVFLNADVSDIEQKEFDLVISMFNIVNHIDTLSSLQNFFASIRKRIKNKGTFIFDAWNGIAVIRNLPKKEIRTSVSPGTGKIILEYKPEIDLMRSQVKMKNSAHIIYLEEIVDHFEYELVHTLWTPKVLTDVLCANDFKVKNVFKAHSQCPATSNDYKISFVAEAI